MLPSVMAQSELGNAGAAQSQVLDSAERELLIIKALVQLIQESTGFMKYIGLVVKALNNDRDVFKHAGRSRGSERKRNFKHRHRVWPQGGFALQA